MKKINYPIFFILVCLLTGCSWIHSKKKDISNRDESIWKEMGSAQFVETGKIVNPQRIANGGNLLIIPFRAGPDVEANDNLDKITLMIIKGVSDIIEENDANLKVLVAQNAQDAEFIIDGHITHVDASTKMNKLILRKNNITLSVKGQMVDRNTGELIAVFTDTLVSNKKEENHRQLGYAIGRNIGRFLLSRSQH